MMKQKTNQKKKTLKSNQFSCLSKKKLDDYIGG